MDFVASRATAVTCSRSRWTREERSRCVERRAGRSRAWRRRPGFGSDANDPRVGVAMCAAFVRSEHVFVGYEDGTVILWWLNLETGVAELAWRRRTHGETTLCVDVDAEGVGAVTGGADGVLVRYVINIDAREPSKATSGRRSNARSVFERDERVESTTGSKARARFVAMGK